MRTFRSHLINIYTFIGIIAAFAFLIVLSGYLFGWITPETITASLANKANQVEASRPAWWLVSIWGWIFAIWTAGYLMKTGNNEPISISEDENGAVEITPEALCNLAKAELKSQGMPRPLKADFTRKLGSPMLQVWVDLTCGIGGDGPVALGKKLKKSIEDRLSKDFNLDGIRVAVIHQPGPRSKHSTQPVSS
jgi:hypothetical protein